MVSIKKQQSKFIVNIAKTIISHMDMHYIDLKHVIFLRTDISNHRDDIHIYRLPRELIKALDIYYVIAIQPAFDLQPEHKMYRSIFHALKHIPVGYKAKPDLVKHDIEMFSEEYLFNKDYRANLNLDHREKNSGKPKLFKGFSEQKVKSEFLKEDKMLAELDKALKGGR